MQKFVILSSIWKRDKYKFLYFPRYENEAVSRQERLTKFTISLSKIFSDLTAGALAQRYVSRLPWGRLQAENQPGRQVSVYFL